MSALPRCPCVRSLLCGALVVTLSMGIRHGFRLQLQADHLYEG